MARRDVNIVDLAVVSAAASTISRDGCAADVARALEAIGDGDLARLFRIAEDVEAYAAAGMDRPFQTQSCHTTKDRLT